MDWIKSLLNRKRSQRFLILALSSILFFTGGCSVLGVIPKEAQPNPVGENAPTEISASGGEKKTASYANSTSIRPSYPLESSFVSTAKNTAALLKEAPFYKITLQPEMEKKQISGVMDLAYRNRTEKEIHTLQFMLYFNDPAIIEQTNAPIKLSKVTVNGKESKYNISGTLLTVPLQTPLRPQEGIDVTIQYTASLPEIPEDGGMMSSDSMMSQLNMMFDQRTEEEKEGEKGSHYGGFFGYQSDIMILGYAYPVLIPPNSEKTPPTHLPTMGDVSRFEAANYEVTLQVPEKVTVAASGVPVEEKKEEGTKKITYQGTGMRDFIFALSEGFTTVTGKAGEHEITVYTSKTFRQHGNELLQYGQNAMTHFEKLYGALPYKKISIVLSPIYGAAGGMEFSGLIIIDDSLYKNGETANQAEGVKENGPGKQDAGTNTDEMAALLEGLFGSSSSQKKGEGSGSSTDLGGLESLLSAFLSEAISGSGDNQSNGNQSGDNGGAVDLGGLDAILNGLLSGSGNNGDFGDLSSLFGGGLPDMNEMMAYLPEMVVAHELAHQWWYSLVGSRSLDAPWLDESITQYSGFIALEKSKGVKARDTLLQNSELTVQMMGMFGNKANQVTLPLKKYTSLSYSALIYEKGALFYHELRKLVGDNAFFSGLKEYAKANQFQFAPLEGPIPFIKEKTEKKKEVDDLVNRWLKG